MTSRRLPPLRLLAAFEAVLRHGGIRRAADEMNVTQPAISQALRQLERHLGVQLLDRRTRPAQLTEEGAILQAATRDGLDRISGAIDRIAAMQRADDGALTVACTVGTATYWLMPGLTGFHERHADVAISVRTTAQGLPPLAPGVDIAIRYGLGTWTDGRVVRLFSERVVPVCGPDLHARLSSSGHDLTDAPLLHVHAGMSEWMDWSEYLTRAGLPTPTRPGIRFTNYVQATQAALGGLGVMLGWRSNVAGFLRRGELRELPLPPVIPEQAFYAVLPPSGGAVPKTTSLLLDWLIATGAEAELVGPR